MARHGLTARAIQREYGIRRERIGEAVNAGELPAARLGARRFLILRDDFEAWLRRHAVRPAGDHVERRVAALLDRERKLPAA